MAVIKSAIELAMERTKNLVLGEEEKKALAAKETESRLRAVFLRYIEGMTEINAVERDLKGIEADYYIQASVLIDMLIEYFNIKDKNERLLELFGIIFADLNESLKDELETLKKRFAEQMERREILVRKDIVERLETEGISGDGLEPNVEAWDEWKEGMEEVKKVFRGRFDEWKNKLKAADR